MVTRLLAAWRHPRLRHAVIIALVATLACLRILITPGMPLHGDLAMPLDMPSAIAQFNSMWDVHGLVSNLENVDRLLVVFPIYFVLELLHASPVWIERIWMWAFLMMSGMSALDLIERLASRLSMKLGSIALVAAIAYMFTPWVMEFVQGPFLWIAYAVFPWFICAIDEFFDDKPIGVWGPLKIAWFWTLGSMIPHTMVFYSGAAIIVIACHFREIFTRRFAFGIVAVLTSYVALNFYWLFTTFHALAVAPISPGYTFTLQQLEQFSVNATLVRAITGREEWIYWYQEPLSGTLAFTVLSMALPCAAAMGFALRRAWRDPLGLALALIFVIFLAGVSGSHDPLYRWLALEAPGNAAYGWLLRGPGKLGFALPIFYCSFGAIFVAWILQHRKVWSIPLVLFVAASCAFTEMPKAATYLWYYYVPVQYAESYYKAMDWLRANAPASDRTMELAPYVQALGKNSLAYEGSFDWNPDRLAGNFVVRSLPTEGIGRYHFTSQAWSPLYDDIEQSTDPVRLLDVARIRYILFHNDLVGAHKAGDVMLSSLLQAGLRRVFTSGEVTILKNDSDLAPQVSDDSGRRVGRVVKATGGEMDFVCTANSRSLRFALPADPYWELTLGRGHETPDSFKDVSLYRGICSPGEKGSFRYLPDIWLKTGVVWQLPIAAFVFILLSLWSKYERRHARRLKSSV